MRFAAMHDEGQSRIVLTIPAKPEYLIVCRLALNGLVDAIPIGDEVLSDLKLAVTEACANSVSHAYGEGDGAITVRIDLLDDRVRVEVTDEGSGIGEPARPTGDGARPVALEEGGMGIALIRALVDELEISPGRDGHGTRVVFTKRLRENRGRGR